MDNEVREIKKSILKLCWHSRGAISYTEMVSLGHEERTIISEIVKDNLEVTKKSGLPYF